MKIVYSQCVPIPGLGFRRGSYKCVCRRGFYFPEVLSEMKYFNGSILEEEYAKLMQVSYDEISPFTCHRDKNHLIEKISKK